MQMGINGAARCDLVQVNWRQVMVWFAQMRSINYLGVIVLAQSSSECCLFVAESNTVHIFQSRV